MNDHRRKGDPAVGDPGAATPSDPARPAPTDSAPDGQPGINLDLYFSTRRRPRSPSWPYLVCAVLMLVVLLAIVAYQDQCGQSVSDTLFPPAATP